MESRSCRADGEVEHASGIIHTLRFGNYFRSAVEAKSYLSFTNTRGPANTPIMVPLMDKNDAGRRSTTTIEFSIADAPRADEIVAVLAVQQAEDLTIVSVTATWI